MNLKQTGELIAQLRTEMGLTQVLSPSRQNRQEKG